MTIPVPSQHDAVVVRAADAEVLGWSSVTIQLLADASATGAAMSVMRTTIGASTEAAKPHTPNQVHAFGTPGKSKAELLIVQSPGLDRFEYFLLIQRLMKGEATMEDLLATQDRYDNHFVDSPSWTARRSSLAKSRRRPRRPRS